MARNNTVAVRFTGDVADLKRATGEAEREIKGFGDRAGPALKGAMLGAGAAAGAVLVDSFFAGMEREDTEARYAASLGLNDEQAKEFGKVAGGLYTDGFGESFEQVAGAVESVTSTIGDELSGDELRPITEKALNLADVFGIDVAGVVSTVGYMLRNDLVRDATEGFDTITVALQKIPAAMREEALEAISEYGASFGALGFDAEESFALILEAAGDTSVGVDKVGDAIKEFLIRSTDGSTAVSDALTVLELDAQDVATAIASGGPAAEEAFGRVVEALLTVEDPAARAQLAVALFGTPIEDLTVTKIPDFLRALQGAEEGLGDVAGASDDLGEQLDTNGRKLEVQKRRLDDLKNAIVYDGVVGALMLFDETLLTLEEHGLRAFARLADEGVLSMDRLTDALGGPARGAKDLLDILNVDLPSVSIDDFADAIGIGESDIKLKAPSTTPSSNIGSDFVPGTRIPLRARGGPVGFGDPYIVGEEGPELFVPAASGQIVPNGQMGGSGGPLLVIENFNSYDRPSEESITHELRRIQLMAL